MASWTSTQTGDWSRASNYSNSPWYDGGTQSGWATIPQDGDTITIANGHVVTYDHDNSADAGYSTITIGTSAASPSAELKCKTSGGPYVLKMDGSHHITGYGKLSAGTTSTPLPQTTSWRILLGSASTIVCTNLDVDLNCSPPTNAYVTTTQQYTSGTTTLAVTPDVSGDTAHWFNGAYIGICNINQGQDYQGPGGSNERTLAGVGSGTITLSTGGLDSTNVVGTYVILVSRNVQIEFTGSQTAINYESSTTKSGGRFGCAVVRTSATSANGNMSLYGTGHILNGVYCGLNNFYYGNGHMISGIQLNVANATRSMLSIDMSGLVFAATYGIYSSSGLVRGTVAGCANGLVYSSGIELSGDVIGCTNGVRSSANILISGTVTKCNIGLFCVTYAIVTGHITSSTLGAIYCTNVTLYPNSDLSSNQKDVYNTAGSGHSYVIGHAARLQSTTQVASYTRSDLSLYADYTGGTFLYDVDGGSGPQIGQVKCWMPGGRIYSITAPDGYPGTHSFVHQVDAEDTLAPAYIDFPLDVIAGKRIAIRWYILCETTETFNTLPRMRIIDPNYTFDDPSSIVAYDNATQYDDWVTRVFSYTPTQSRSLILRFYCIGSSTSAINHCYWNYEVVPSPMLPEPIMSGGH